MSSDSGPPDPQVQHPFGAPPVAQAQPSSKSNFVIIAIVCCVLAGMMLVCGGVLVALLLPAVGAARQAARRMQRQNNVKMIGLAMHNYHSAYNQLPFTEVTDDSGRSMLGWRLAVSPFAEGQVQWDALAKDEPWDSQTNAGLIQNPPLAFQTNNGEVGMTSIFAIETPSSLFPPTPMTPVAFRDVADGLSNTLMLIELPNRSVEWTTTTNLSPDEAFAAIRELQSPEVAHVLMGDGAVHAITSDIDRETFDVMITKDGGETANLGF